MFGFFFLHNFSHLEKLFWNPIEATDLDRTFDISLEKKNFYILVRFLFFLI